MILDIPEWNHIDLEEVLSEREAEVAASQSAFVDSSSQAEPTAGLSLENDQYIIDPFGSLADEDDFENLIITRR